MTAGACRTLCGHRWSRFCRPGRGTRWAVTTRACRTVRQWMRSFSFCAPGVIGMPWARRVSGSSSSAHRRFQEWVGAGVFAAFWRAGLLAYDALQGIDWTWLALDGAMGKAPLGGEKNRPQSDRPRQARGQALAADRRPRRAPWGGDRRGQPQRPQADAPDPRSHPGQTPQTDLPAVAASLS